MISIIPSLGLAQLPIGAKPLKDFVSFAPFILELQTIKLKSSDRDVPNELRGVINGQQITISGTKKTGEKNVMGRGVGHFGKIVLIGKGAAESGSLSVRVPWADANTYYGIALELTSGVLQPNNVRLVAGTTYKWQASVQGTEFVFEIFDKDRRLDVLRATSDVVKSFGFYTTVRHIGNKSDITINVDPLPLKR
jgi:hypothetical protein